MNPLTPLIEKIPKNCAVRFNEFNPDISGLVVIYPFWSADQRYLDDLISLLNNISHPELSLYIIDIDTDTCRVFERHYQLLHQGKCEMYAMDSGHIIAAIKEHDKNNSTKQICCLINKLAEPGQAS